MGRNSRIEWSVVKQTVQYGFFLVVCLWLLYQVHHSLYVGRDTDCDFTESRLIEERMVKVLGRKGGASISLPQYSREDLELYGVDLIREADRIKKGPDTEYDHSDTSDTEGMDQEESSDQNVGSEIVGETSSTEGQTQVLVVSVVDNRVVDQGSTQSDQVNQTEVIQFSDKTLENEVFNSEEDRSEDAEESQNEESEETDRESEVRVRSVILKKDESVEVFRFNDENGIPEHESAPSRRSDLQSEFALNASISDSGSQNKNLVECTQLCLQNATEQIRSSEIADIEAVNEEMPVKMEVITSRQGGMRELLLSGR